MARLPNTVKRVYEIKTTIPPTIKVQHRDYNLVNIATNEESITCIYQLEKRNANS